MKIFISHSSQEKVLADSLNPWLLWEAGPASGAARHEAFIEALPEDFETHVEFCEFSRSDARERGSSLHVEFGHRS